VVSVTADSNIWVSAFNFKGNPRQLIELADSGSVRIDVSDAILDEVLRVLRLKFLWSDESLAEAKLQ
jgi:predicted nucleic acid-binding protein